MLGAYRRAAAREWTHASLTSSTNARVEFMADRVYPLTITNSMSADLELAVRSGVDLINELQRKVVAIQPPTIRQSIVLDAARKIQKSGETKTIVQLCLTLASLKNRLSLETNEILASLKEGLKKRKDWSDKLSDIDATLHALGELMDADSIVLSAKAMELSYLHNRLYTSARLTTDVRPVFDDLRLAILGAIVSHTIHLDFYENGRNSEISIALDESDIKNLMKVCRQALEKSAAAQKAIKLENEDNVVVVGEEKYGVA